MNEVTVSSNPACNIFNCDLVSSDITDLHTDSHPLYCDLTAFPQTDEP